MCIRCINGLILKKQTTFPPASTDFIIVFSVCFWQLLELALATCFEKELQTKSYVQMVSLFVATLLKGLKMPKK